MTYDVTEMIYDIPKGKKPSDGIGEDNVVYFLPTQRVKWRGKLGTIASLDVKSYPYPVGYNVRLDTQEKWSYPAVTNSSAGEIVPVTGTYYRGYVEPTPTGETPVILPCKAKAPGFVYLIQELGTGAYKIGIAANVQKRMASLKTGTPYGIELIHSFPCSNPAKVEAELHQQFAPYRLQGEWFALPDEAIAYIQSITGDSYAKA